MASGTPVVGSAVGGVQHTVADGVTGLLVPPNDPAALAERLLRLQREPALAARVGGAGTRRLRTGFTWEHVAQRLARLYRRVCEARALPARYVDPVSKHMGAWAGVGAAR